MNITVKRLINGDTEPSFLLTYPRFINNELMSNGVMLDEGQSSAETPVNEMLRETQDNPAIPIWANDDSGLRIDLHAADVKDASAIWLKARDSAMIWADMLESMGVHQENINYLLEPFRMVKTIVSAAQVVMLLSF